ncbi:MAG: hypothetical protein KF777_18130 [Planctomycetaceae bacterium]|nr:hypothetical protein [Planctomycetaceae bacterium]
MDTIRRRVSAVHSRQQWQWAGQCAAWGLCASSILACLVVLGVLAQGITSPGWGSFALLLLSGPALGGLAAFALSRPVHKAANAIDGVCGLKDRVSTAWAFLSKSNLTPLQELQVADAATHVANIDVKAVAPYRSPRSLHAGVVFAAVATLLMCLIPAPEVAIAATEPNAVVHSQASRAEEELKELEEFNKQAKDPEIEKLLKELAVKVEELKQPGIDPREALAKLSEMEAALQAKQQELADPNVEAQLKSIGEALSLSESLQSAGQALANGELEKAADELEKKELPKVDRQTERAMTEKLEQVRQDSADGMKKQLKEAIGQIGEGLGQGNKSKFNEGMKGLAGESRSAGRRKKLTDLLRKQCQCLSECKSECEGECQSQSMAMSNKKGGSKAGQAASGNEPGEKTGLLKSAKDMKLTGQESAEGDVDIETTTAPEQNQEAIRQYREKVDKYEAISESVLDAESIPLGHRQNIRRYFEMIRPQGNEGNEASEPVAP